MLDKSIISECLKGNRKAQEKLYSFYSSKMRGICIRYSRSSFEAEDLFQEAFIKVFANLKNFKGEGSFDGWIRRIVTNTAIDYYRKHLHLSENINFENVAEEQLLKVEIPDNMEAEDLLKILTQLPDGYRLVFNLFAIEGYSHKEISEMLNISEGTSKSQLTKARRYIQQLLHKNKIVENETRTI